MGLPANSAAGQSHRWWCGSMIGKSASKMGSVGAVPIMLISDAVASILHDFPRAAHQYAADRMRSGRPARRLAPHCTKKQKIYKNFISLQLAFSGRPRIDFHCEEFDGCHLFADSRGPLWRNPCAGVGSRAARKDVMTIMYGLAALLALFLFGYLLYAL